MLSSAVIVASTAAGHATAETAAINAVQQITLIIDSIGLIAIIVLHHQQHDMIVVIVLRRLATIAAVAAAVTRSCGHIETVGSAAQRSRSRDSATAIGAHTTGASAGCHDRKFALGIVQRRRVTIAAAETTRFRHARRIIRIVILGAAVDRLCGRDERTLWIFVEAETEPSG